METKEIKEILSEIGITNNCYLPSNCSQGESFDVDYYPELVRAIQKFMEYIETNEMNKLMIHLKDNPIFSEYLKTPRIECLDFLLIENKKLTKENAELKEEVKHLNEISNSIYSDLQDSINR